MQLFQDPSGTGQIFRSLVILHQLFNDRRINPRLLAFLALFFSLLLLGHFHLLSQVVTHTQNFPTPSSFRASGLTRFLEEGGTLEGAQNIADHADSRTTKLYDRRQQIFLREDVERIRYWGPGKTGG